MNMDNYKEAMKEIPISADEIEAKLYERIKTEKKIKNKLNVRGTMPVFALASVILLICILWYRASLDSPAITVKVLAAEQEAIPLSKEFITIDKQVAPFYGGYSGDDQNANVTYHIHFICEGEGIDTITYILSEKEVTRDNRAAAPAYYVENITLPVEEYRNMQLSKEENFISGFYGEGEEDATIIKMIGSSYTVKDEEQEEIAYGLVVAASVDEEENFRCEDLVIRIKIGMEDGSTVNKQLLLEFGEDAFHEVQIKILN